VYQVRGYVIEFNKKAAGSIYAEIAKRLGLQGSTEDELVDALVAMVRAFNDKMAIPQTLKDFGVCETDFQKQLSDIAAAAVSDPCTGTNPREISPSEMAQLFTCAYYGDKVNF
jgi:alcohol dehydrogenase class IV